MSGTACWLAVFLCYCVVGTVVALSAQDPVMHTNTQLAWDILMCTEKQKSQDCVHGLLFLPRVCSWDLDVAWWGDLAGEGSQPPSHGSSLTSLWGVDLASKRPTLPDAGSGLPPSASGESPVAVCRVGCACRHLLSSLWCSPCALSLFLVSCPGLQVVVRDPQSLPDQRTRTRTRSRLLVEVSTL